METSLCDGCPVLIAKARRQFRALRFCYALGAMFGTGFRRKSTQRHDAVGRITAWARERFGLSGETAVSVAEVECRLPGCAPLETVVSFWDADGRRYHFKVFKPLEQVLKADLPHAWMKEAIRVPEGGECDCC